MGRLLQSCVISGFLFGAATAHAECSVSSDPGSAVRQLNPAIQTDADLVISMTMLPKIMHIDYDGAASRTGCDLGPLATGDATYELWGDDSGLRQRKAVSSKGGSPLALIVPVIDIMKALTAQKQGQSAKVEGYLLATISKHDFTAWRYYTGMPDAAALKHDMADALAGTGSPIFRNGADGKTSLFVPKS